MKRVLGVKELYLIVGACFFVSGVLSLVYEVTWVRMLSLFFGTDVYAASITLSVFMGGLALGSFIMGRIGDRIATPFLVYGACEVLLSLFAFAVPHALDILLPVYKFVYGSSFDSAPWAYELFRVSVAAIILLLPTACMGATLPILVRALSRNIGELGFDTGFLYGLNLAGAVVGVLAAGFVLLPYIGVALTVSVTATTGLLLGVISITLGYFLDGMRIVPASGKSPAASPVLTLEQKITLGIMALSGACALALEVVWMRLLVQTFFSDAQVFSIMLACFLLGLCVGSFLIGRIADGLRNPLRTLIGIQIALGVFVAFVLVLSIYLHAAVAMLSVLLGQGMSLAVANMAAKFVVALAVIAIPAMLLGATFPVSVRAFTHEIERRSEAAGKIYAWNTAGGIFGALLGGFVLLPLLGTAKALICIAGIFFLNGLIAEVRLRRQANTRIPRQSVLRGGLALLFVCVFAVAGLVPAKEFSFRTNNAQWATVDSSEVIYRSDGALSTVVVVADANRKTLVINGGTVAAASTNWGQNKGFVFKSIIPLLLHPDPERVGVMGYGMGITAQAAVLYPAVQSVRIVELSQSVLDAQPYVADINGDVLKSGKVQLRLDDARNFMNMTDETFDMITTDPVHPRIVGVGDLYSKEYYESIRSHLRAGGFIVQWIPILGISSRSFDVAVRTFVDVFPNTTVWYEFGQVSLVATIEPTRIDCAVLAKNLSSPDVQKNFPFLASQTPHTFLSNLLMGPTQVHAYLTRNGDAAINTDDNSYLQYHVPFEYPAVTDAADIVKNLSQYAGRDATIFDPNCRPYTSGYSKIP